MSHPADSLAALSAALRTALRGISSCLVSVTTESACCTGFSVAPGLIAAADEAVAEDGMLSVTLPDGETVAGEIAGRDAATDIALIRISRPDLPPAPLVDEVPETGSFILVAGSCGGLPLAAFGIVARNGPAWRSMRGGEIDARVELDVTLRGAGEGGLALDGEGRPFGMAVFGPRGSVLVIPAATIRRVVPKLAAHGRIPRGYLGLGLQSVALDGGGEGAMVLSVDPAGPAAAAGLMQGDILAGWEAGWMTGRDGAETGSAAALLRRLGPESVGRSVTLHVVRGGERHEIAATIAERPAP